MLVLDSIEFTSTPNLANSSFLSSNILLNIGFTSPSSFLVIKPYSVLERKFVYHSVPVERVRSGEILNSL
jgi:hypothetical protein